MGYVDKNLQPNEKIVLRARLHWAMFLGPAILMGLTLIIGIAVIVTLLQAQDSQALSDIRMVLCFLIPIFLLGVLFLVSAIMSYTSTEFAMTDHRIIARTGLLRQKSLDLALDKVGSVGVSQTIMGKLFNFGNLEISGADGTKVTFPNLADIMILQQSINSKTASNP